MTGQKTPKDSEIFEVLDRLEKRVNSDPQFTKGDEETIREMLKAYKGLLAVSHFSKFLIVTLALIATLIASWKTIAGGIRSWLIG